MTKTYWLNKTWETCWSKLSDNILSAPNLQWVRTYSEQCGNSDVYRRFTQTNWTSKNAVSEAIPSTTLYLNLRCSLNSARLPFIWSSLKCRGPGVAEESQVSTSRSDNRVCWFRQLRANFCENVVTLASFISSWKQGHEEHISLFSC